MSTVERAVYVCTDPGIPVFGSKGASVHVQAILRVLCRRGVEVHLVTARLGGAAPQDLSDVVVHELPPIPGGEPRERELAAQRSDAAVADVLDEIAAAGAIDLVYERYALWGRSAMRWARRQGVRSLLEVNAPLIEEQRTHRVLVHESAADDVARSALSDADGVSCVSEGVAAWVRGLVPDARATVVPNGVDTRAITPGLSPFTRPPGTFTIGFVGTLKPWHGVEQLLEAVALLRADHEDTHCLVVGDGPQADVLDELSLRLGIADVVERTGAVLPHEIPSLLHRMDVATAPYPSDGVGTPGGFYFSPLKLYEYLAAGLPVVASRVGEIPALLEHGRWGALVRPGDPRELATAISALRSDLVRRQCVHDEAPKHARAHDWEHVLSRSLEVIGARLRERELTDVAR